MLINTLLNRLAMPPTRTNRLIHVASLAGLCLAWSTSGLAEIYKFVDENGMVTYTNMPRPGIKPETVIPDGGKASPAPASPKRQNASRASTPAYFPRVDTGTQRKRDDMRRQLLEEEMGSEQRNLAAARSALNAGSRQPGTDLRKLLDAVKLHEKNIEMLNKELSHVR